MTLHTTRGTPWALILGASSGFGAATARELARRGFNICGIHLDLKATLPMAKQVIADIEATGRRALFINMNAADETKRAGAIEKLKAAMAEESPPGYLQVVMHSLAFGSLLPFIADRPEEAISKAQLDMTLDVMANSLVYWVQDLVRQNLLVPGSRIFAMTSAGSHRVIINYGAVSAAKAALESHCRQLAYELGRRGIRVNAIEAGVTDTPALRKIPGHEIMIAEILKRNPSGRMTTTEDVAGVIATLAASEATAWINGTVIRVDGGEDIAG